MHADTAGPRVDRDVLPTSGMSRAGGAVALVWAIVVVAVYYRQAWSTIPALAGVWELADVRAVSGLALPYWREALGRAAWAGIGAGAVTVAALGIGRRVNRWMRLPASGTERIAFDFATGCGVLGLAFFALALGGLYRPRIVTAAIATLAVLTLIGGGRAVFRQGAAWVGRAAVGARLGARDPFLCVTAIAVALAAWCALAPETEYDALWYHLELPRRWLAAGGPVDDLTEYVSLYPLHWELLFGGAMTIGGPVAARLLHWATLPVTAILVSRLTSELFPRTPPSLAAALAVTAPTVFWEATTAYVDLALAMHVAAGCLALARVRSPGDRSWILAAGVQFGFACATKHLGLVALAAALLAFGGCTLHRLRLAALAKLAAVVVVVAMLVPLPWYARALARSGNPFFPELYPVFGASPPERWDHENQEAHQRFKDHFGRPRTASNLATLPWDMTMHGTRYGGTIGPVLLLCLPGVIAVTWRNRGARWMAAGALAYFVVWASPISSYQARFLVPWWIASAPLVAAGLHVTLTSVAAGRTWVARGLAIALAVLLAFNLPPATPLHEGDRRGWTGWLTHVVHVPPSVVAGAVSDDAWIRRHVRSYAAWQWINTHTRAGAYVLTFIGGDHLYSHRARIWSESVIARPATWDAEAGDLARTRVALQRLGVTHVLAPAPAHRTPEQAKLDVLSTAMERCCLETVFSDYWTVVYAVRPGTSPSGATDQ